MPRAARSRIPERTRTGQEGQLIAVRLDDAMGRYEGMAFQPLLQRRERRKEFPVAARAVILGEQVGLCAVVIGNSDTSPMVAVDPFPQLLPDGFAASRRDADDDPFSEQTVELTADFRTGSHEAFAQIAQRPIVIERQAGKRPPRRVVTKPR